MADESETIYGFSKGDSDALLRLRGGNSATSGSVNSTPFDGSTVYSALTTTAITAKTALVPGTGKAMIQTIPDAGAMTNFQEVDVINTSTTAIQTGKNVLLFRVGMKLVAVELC